MTVFSTLKSTTAALTLLLVVATLGAGPAWGQDGTIVAVVPQEASAGEAVDVPVEVLNVNEVGSVDLTVNFDPDSLSFSADPSTSDLIEGAPRSGFEASVPEPGELRISWFDDTGGDAPLTLADDTLLTITFSQVAGVSDVSIDASNSEFVAADGGAVGARYFDGIVTDRLRRVSAGTVPDAPLGDTASVALSGQDLANVGSASLKIGFDPSILQFVGLANDNSNLRLQANAEDGIVTVGGFNADGGTMGTDFADLRFVFKGGSSPLRVLPSSEVTDPTGVAYPVRFADGRMGGVTPSLRIPNLANTPDDTTNVAVATNDLRELGSASVTVRYAPDTLDFIGTTNATQDFNLEVGTPEPGVIRIGGFSTSGVDPDGALVGLRFADKEEIDIPFETPIRVRAEEVELTNPEGAVYNATVASGRLRVRPIPVRITRVSPTAGAPEQRVTIKGSGFSPTASQNTVTFGDVEATVTQADSSVLTTQVPSGVVGPTQITVEKGIKVDSSARRFTGLRARTRLRSLPATDVGLNALQNASVALGDLDGDNHLDVVATGETSTGSPATRLYENDGDGTYSLVDEGFVDVRDGSVALGDLDGDNHLDVVVTGEADDGTPVTRVYENNGTGSFFETNAGLNGVSNGSVALGDLDGDNHLDVLLTGTNANGVSTTLFYSNDGTGSFRAMDESLVDLTNGSVALGDLNGDNRLDVALLGEQADGTPTTRLYQNDGTGSFRAMDESLVDLTNGSVALGDLNGDNRLDVATVGENANGTPVTQLYSNDGGGSFGMIDAGLPDVGGGSVALGDLNGNNRIDVAVSGTNPTGDRTLAVSRKTSGGWTAVGPGPITFVPKRGGMAWSDTDGDGDLDLTVFGTSPGTEGTTAARVYENVYPTPTGLTATAASGEVSLDWQSTAGDQLQRYHIYRSLAPIDSLGNPAFLTPYDSTMAGTTSYTDAGLDDGQTYYYRVTAVASTEEESPLSTQDYGFLYPQSVEFNVTRSFGDASSVNDYRLVALPGEVDRPLGETLSGAAGTEWQAWWDTGASSTDFLVRFDGSDTFRFQRGRGFWLTSRSDWSVDDSLSTVTLQEDTASTIPVNDGWTIIANPYGKAVDWDLVQRANEEAGTLWEFEGAFDPASTFESARRGKAYYFFNDTGKDSLTVPYPGAPRQPEVTNATEQRRPLLSLSARPAASSSDGPASTVRVGLAATDDAEQSVVAPPMRFSTVSLRVMAGTADGRSASSPEESAGRTRRLMTSRRVAEDGGRTFRLRLRSEGENPVRLSASNLQAADVQAAALLDPTAGRTYDLQANESITLDPEEEGPRRLKVAVGSKQYVEQEKETVLPKTVRLTSYPNPVRRQGTIAYALPEEETVSLRVYDVLGREVATLATGRKEAGRHTVRLETGQWASGVYFGRLQAGDQTRTLKITVVR